VARALPDEASRQAPAAGRWPDFIGIGTIKSGTTWLWQCLREHPSMFLPVMKELEYFDTRFELGEEWYREFFRDADGRICGEISPQYVHCPAAFERMAPLAGRVKLIVCFRNPADRAFSHYMMDAREERGLTQQDKVRRFDELVRSGGSKYVEFGRYSGQIAPYLRRFGRDSVHAVFFEDISSDPLRVFRETCAFLGVDPAIVPASLASRVNASKRYRSVRLFKGLQAGVRAMEAVGLERLVLYLKRTAVRDQVLRMLETPEDYEPMLPGTRRHLVDLYREGNERLAELFGRDLSGWNRV